MLKSAFVKLVKHGRQIVGDVFQKQAPKDVIRIGLEKQPKFHNVAQQPAKLQGLGNGQSILSQYLARSVTRSLAAEMRNKFALRTPAGSWNIFGGARLQGNRLSLYAFVGVGLAAGNQWQNRESEGFDTVCDEIRGMFKTPPSDGLEDTCNTRVGRTLNDFEIGSLIAKGCNAAVYEAKFRRELVEEEEVVTPGEQSESLMSEGSVVSSGEDGEATESESLSHTSISIGEQETSTFDPKPVTLDLDLESWSSSIEILKEEDMACVTEFDPGGSGNDIRWHFEIVPLEEVAVGLNNTGWTDGENELTDSIEVISDVELAGIPVVTMATDDTSTTSNAPATTEQGAVLIGEWDVRLEDAVNLDGLERLQSLESDTSFNVSALFNSTSELDLDLSIGEYPPSLSDANPAAGPSSDLGSQSVPDPPPLPAGLEEETSKSGSAHLLDQDSGYDLAIKMMFNYDAESNAPSILRTMAKELVPAKLASLDQSSDMIEISHHWKTKHLPPHPNIVDMHGVFVDWFPHLPEAWEEYPDAMPDRLNPGGFGRNQTMFLVMKRYPKTLREYLETESPSVEESSRLLTQLVEAVVHMTQHGIAHRDMKSDNILLEFTDAGPHLVLSDFGCCTTEGLYIPYPSWEVDRGGNGSLMAPEISTATPGMFLRLNYTKADLWAVGAIAYEMFGCGNPFYRDETGHKLDSRTYRENDLPPLPDSVPVHLKNIVHQMLTRDLAKRPSPARVANMLHLAQWAPPAWTSAHPASQEVKRWLLTLTAVVVCQRFGQGQSSQRPDHQLKKLFLSRVHLDDVILALNELW